MEDKQIINLFLERSESAILHTMQKYGAYCRRIAFNVLGNADDSEECLNDCMLRTWNSIPPEKPDSLKAYIGKITRNLALDKYNAKNAEKRGGVETDLVLDELGDCVSGGEEPEAVLLAGETASMINEFLAQLPSDKRKLFVRRYWYMDSLSDIAERFGLKESNVKTILFRLRKDLAEYLRKEGVEI